MALAHAPSCLLLLLLLLSLLYVLSVIVTAHLVYLASYLLCNGSDKERYDPVG